MKAQMKKPWLILPVLGLMLTFVVGCSDDDEDNPMTNSPQAQVMVVHSSPNAPAVDVLVDNAVALDSVTFPVNSSYLPVPAGTRNVKINVDAGGTNVIDSNLTVTDGNAFSVFAIDSVSNVRLAVFADDLSDPASGNAHLRFIHLSPNAPAVNITDNSGNIISGFGSVAFTETAGFVPLPAGTYNLQVRDAATNNTVVLTLNNVTLTDGQIYTVWASGFLSGSPALDAQIIVNK